MEPVTDDPELTGERTVPGVPDETYWFARHVAGYRWAAEEVAGTVVLDAGCGEGYGLALLEEAGARRVVGVDLDEGTVAHARARYGSEVVEVHRGELSELSLDVGAFDVVVSLQVIEHLWDVPGFLGSLRRIARPSSRLRLTTPNRLTFTPVGAPRNPFHAREFASAELAEEVVAAGWRVTEIAGLVHGPRLSAHEPTPGALPQRLATTPPASWDDQLRGLVHSTTPDDFLVRGGRLDQSLDLLLRAEHP